MAKQNSTPLLRSEHYEYSNRPVRDVVWAALYLFFVAAVVAGGVYGALNRSPVYDKATTEYLANGTNCQSRGTGLNRPQFRGTDVDFIVEFLERATPWFFGSILLGSVAGSILFVLLKTNPVTMTKVGAGCSVAFPIGLSAFLALYAGLPAALPILIVAAINSFVFLRWRSMLDLCGQLIGFACDGLYANPGLIFFALLQALVSFLAMIGALLAGSAAYTNGQVVPNPGVVGQELCTDSAGAAAPCCVWQPDAWVLGYWPLIAAVLTWTLALIGCIRLFVVAGTIGQWYFAPPSLSGSTRGMTRRSIRHALGPAFGSCCFGSAVISVCQYVRQAAQRNDTSSAGAMCISCLMRSIMSCLASLIEYLSKFAVVRMALTGEPFFTAGREAAGLLARNYLKSVSVWWFPGWVLGMTNLVVGAAWGCGVWGITTAAWGRTSEYGSQEALIVACVSGVVCIMALSFFGALLLQCVDSVYMCYAMDLDAAHVTRPEVHGLYEKIPNLTTGAAVQQPGGEYAYAQLAPDEPTAAPQRVVATATLPPV